MRAILTVLLATGVAWGQAGPPSNPTQSSQPSPALENPHFSQNQGEMGHPASVVIPAGSKVPLSLKQAISTKNAREGDAVYAETVFPFVANDRVLIPAGTYIQGKIMHAEHAGRSKKRAEILIHFTSMIYPSGYTVMLPGSIENTPGADNKAVKDAE